MLCISYALSLTRELSSVAGLDDVGFMQPKNSVLRTQFFTEPTEMERYLNSSLNECLLTLNRRSDV